MLRVLPLLALWVSVARSVSCRFDFPESFVSYDLSSIAAQTWTWTGPYQHTFSFCSTLPGVTCTNGLATSSGSGFSPGTCTISWGSAAKTNATLQYADATGGLSILYSAGNNCPMSPGNTYATVILGTCSSVGGLVIAGHAVDTTGCVTTFRVSSSAFCGTLNRVVVPRALSVAGLVTLIIASGLLVYCAGGAAYKRRVHGARGLESLPNIDFWRAAAAACARAINVMTCGLLFRQAVDDADEYKDLRAAGDLDEPGLI
jgi:hypothetical protein